MAHEKEKKESLRDRLEKDEERLERDENAWLELQESTNKEIAQLAGLVLRTRQYYKSEIRKIKLKLTQLEKRQASGKKDKTRG